MLVGVWEMKEIVLVVREAGLRLIPLYSTYHLGLSTQPEHVVDMDGAGVPDTRSLQELVLILVLVGDQE